MSADFTTNPHDDTFESMSEELLPDSARDLLISRVIDGRASANDWDRFRAMAAREPTIWSELGETQQQHESIRAELAEAIAIADRVDLPIGPIDDTHTRQRLGMVSKWGGWAAAAALLVVWSLGNPMAPSSVSIDSTQTGTMIPGTGFTAGIGLSEAQPEQAFERYLSAGQKSGQVIAEMPEQVVVETRPLPDGTIEVLFLRQIIERRVIDQAYREVRDESGNIFALPVRVENTRNNAF